MIGMTVDLDQKTVLVGPYKVKIILSTLKELHSVINCTAYEPGT